MPREHSLLLTVVAALMTAAVKSSAVSAGLPEATGCRPRAEDAVGELSETDVSVATVGGEPCLYSNAVEARSPREKFRRIGGSAQSRPCCTSWGPGRIDCFVQGPKANVLHIQGADGEWQDLGNIVIIGDIECVSRDVGVIDVFVQDRSSRLRVNTYAWGQWSGWKSLGGSVMEVPSCVARTKSIVNCMSRKMDGTYQHIGSVSGD